MDDRRALRAATHPLEDRLDYVHDTAHCLEWAVLDVERLASLQREVEWLTNVLRSRGFPLEHLARNLELAADVVDERVADNGPAVAERLRSAAATVRDG